MWFAWGIVGQVLVGVAVLTVLGFAVMETRDVAKYMKLVRMSSGRKSLH
ncbi:MAG: hypothetical protein ACREPZ_08670 [Rhodanobacteraceae bacterium]